MKAWKCAAVWLCWTPILSGCGPYGDEAEARKVVLSILKDPDSAKFGKFDQVPAERKDRNGKSETSAMACLTVNARNSMGGYTGDQQASLTKSNGKWQTNFVAAYESPMGVALETITPMTHEQCMAALASSNERARKSDELAKQKQAQDASRTAVTNGNPRGTTVPAEEDALTKAIRDAGKKK